eukprot:Unigene16307_Nuclearia_a/m.48364 Unigene16307_Nuclearia_a/g.48364  ORF Unigene16307_Nuclearia_a/g.48364 Unigene16307_Nuclearia_a/m.48364 type:complete len:301 (+) Unigene16307_Nuclearia_a:119-1021(+)
MLSPQRCAQTRSRSLESARDRSTHERARVHRRGAVETRADEVGTAQVDLLHVADLKVGVLCVRPGQHGKTQVAVAQVCLAQRRHAQVGARQVRVLKLRALEVRAFKNRALARPPVLKVAPAHNRAVEVGTAKHGADQARARKVHVGHLAALERAKVAVGLAQLGVAKVGVGKVAVAQVESAEVDADEREALAAQRRRLRAHDDALDELAPRERDLAGHRVRSDALLQQLDQRRDLEEAGLLKHGLERYGRLDDDVPGAQKVQQRRKVLGRAVDQVRAVAVDKAGPVRVLGKHRREHRVGH